MLFKAILDNLGWEFFFATQPQQAIFNICFIVIFVGETHKSFLKH